LALILPVFLVLIMILFDFGRVIYAQNAISSDAREGGRVAIVDAGFSTAKYDSIRAAAKRFSPLVSLTDADITGRAGVTCPVVPDPNGGCFYPDAPVGGQPVAGQETEVNVRVTVLLITPIISNLLGGSFTLTARSVNFIQCSGC
jgi:Flp pilus assembly protein TadG